MIKVFVIMLFSFWSPIDEIAKVNQLKEEGEKAFLEGNYELASQKYSYLIDTLGIKEDELRLNLSHSYFHLGDTSNASDEYIKLILSENKSIKSVAYQQLGVLSSEKQKYSEALIYFKESLKSNPLNDDSRYNYELLRKKMKEEEEKKKKNEDKKDEDKNKDDDKKKQEPSEYAKQLKKQAEALVAQHRYHEAYQLMQEGLKKDPTVELFKDFIEKIQTVVKIL